MKIVKAKKKLEVPRELALSKTYSRIRRPQPASITTLNVQNERWNSFNQKAAELASCHKANIIILAHFPDCENEPAGMSYVSAFGDIAKEYQGKIVLQNLANKFAQKCAQPDQSTESSQEEETDSSAKDDHHQPSLVTVVRNNSEVIDQVATDSAKEPTCLTNQIEDEEEMMEDIVVSMTESEAIKSFSSPRSTSSMIKDDENPRVLTLNNYSPLKTYSVSPKSGKTSSRVLQAVQLKPRPLGKPVFVSNGHTYASLEDGSVVKVVPIQFARQDAGHNKEVQVEEVASAIEVASSESSTPLPPGCVEIIMSTEINEAIEAMNNDVLAAPSEDTSVVVVEHLQQPLFNNDETTAERKRGRPRRGGAPYPSASSVPRSSRNDKSNYKFKCDFCTRSFRDSFDLKVHVRTHTGERPFRCDECDQSFSLKCTLKVHQLLHTGERPFQCELCDKAFTRNDYLTRHLTSHTGSKPFTCPKCKKGFALRGRLNKHQRDLKHFDDTPPVADWGPLTDL